MRHFTAGAALLVPLFHAACGGEHIPITVSSESEDAIAEAAPSSDYSFLVLADSPPTDLADVRTRNLVVCGSLGTGELVQLMAASDAEGTVLFKSVRHHFVNPNLISGSLTMPQVLTVTLSSGEQLRIFKQSAPLPRDATDEQLLESCMEGFGAGDVLLFDRDLEVRQPEEFVRLVFGQ